LFEDHSADSEELEMAIKVLFPLIGVMRFELLKADGGGGGRSLSRVSASEDITKVEDLNLIIGRNIVYIRPFASIIEVSS
jgi:hypothetical protein